MLYIYTSTDNNQPLKIAHLKLDPSAAGLIPQIMLPPNGQTLRQDHIGHNSNRLPPSDRNWDEEHVQPS